jgi:hypothetical protein
MFTSITGTDFEATEQVPTSSFPPVWVGFVFAFIFLVVEVAFVIVTFDWEEEASAMDARVAASLGLLGLPGIIYWMYCIHRLHKILAQMTHGRYPNSPLETALKHLIPFYNLYWIFKWPGEFSDYLNRRGRVKNHFGCWTRRDVIIGDDRLSSDRWSDRDDMYFCGDDVYVIQVESTCNGP